MTAYHDYDMAENEQPMSRRGAKDSALRRALRRNTYAATGLLGLIICGAIAAALITWHVTDPSRSNATEVIPRNMLGLPGAFISDLLIQAFGLASAFLLIPPFTWCWRLLRLEPTRMSRQSLMAWFGGLGAIAIAFSTIPAPSSWPLPLSLGGMIGDSFLYLVGRIDVNFMSGLGAILVGTAATAGGVLLFLSATDTTLRDIIPRRQRGQVEIIDEYEDADDLQDDQAFAEPEGYDEPSLDARDPAGTITRKTKDGKQSGLWAVPLGALSHWLLSRRTAQKRHAHMQDQQHPAQSQPQQPQQPTQKPSLWNRLLGPDNDGLDAYADRLEPHWGTQGDTRGQHHHAQQAQFGAQPSPYATQDHGAAYQDHPEQHGYADDAQWQAPHPLDGNQQPPWDDDMAMDASQPAQGQPQHGQPMGIAPPAELNRPSSDPERQAQTNSAVESKPAAAKGSTRMVRSGQGNLFTRKQEYQYPPINFLAEPETLGPNAGLTADQLEHNARLLEGVLSDFGIRGEIIKVRPGPVVTLYELEPAPGIKSSRVIGLADDIARSMSAISARVAVVPGRNAIGIELPNARRETVFLREMLAAKDFEKSKAKLPICLGKNISGDPVVVDLARMPHVLVAGTTGSGKSVSINTTIMSLLYKHRPEECRLIMIDPKMLELSIYDGIPHLLTPVVTDPSKAVVALKWAVREMEQRYKNMSKMGVRNIDGFNNRVRQSLAKGDQVTRTIQTGFDPETGDPIYEQEELNLEPMPYIVIVVDEMADLMMVAGKDIEGAIQRLAQMARAAGIHLIMATQRPSVDVITGTIKANFPTRMSFQVTSKIDSRTILGEMGAEQLLGMGDMLYMAGGGRIQRVHGAFITDEEVESVVNHLKLQGTPDYLDAVTEETEADQAEGGKGGGSGGEGGTLYDKAVDIVILDRKASTSYIQRRLSIGYNRAATLIEQMEQEGVISPANHAGKREILVPEEGATM